MNSCNAIVFFFLCLSASALGCGQGNETHGSNDSGANADIDAGPPDCLDQWEKIGEFPDDFWVTSVWGTGPNDLFAVATDYNWDEDYLGPGNWLVFHYDGSNWMPMDLGEAQGKIGFAAIWGASESDLFLVWSSYETQQGFISHYDGNDWTAMDVGIELSFGWDYESLGSPIWGSAGNDLFVVNLGGTILHYDGESWSNTNIGNDVDLVAIWGFASNDVFVGGLSSEANSRHLFHYDGQRWEPLGAIDYGMDIRTGPAGVLDMWAASDDDIYVRARFGLAGGRDYLHYDGKQWSSADDLSICGSYLGPVIDIWGTRKDNVYALCSSRHISHFDGTEWTGFCYGIPGEATSIYGTSEHDIFLFGGDDVYHSNGYSE